MAKEAQRKDQHTDQKVSREIIKAQNKEINQMKVERHRYPKAGDKPMAHNAQMGHMMEMSSEQMNSMLMNMDLGALCQFDLRFINAMILTIILTMAQDALGKSKRAEIKH